MSEEPRLDPPRPPPPRLDWQQKQKVSYCIPLWLRDEQIKLNIARIPARIEPHPERSEPIACVSFGPSLNETWEKLRDFKYIMTCSGSHKFLVERGIIPTWHVEVDPREHKVGLMGPPQKDTTYLIASTCHPKLLDHLEGHDVKLWHVFDTGEEAARVLPRGEWCITGGCSVGLRTLTLSTFLGFRNLHVFGMDCCKGASGSHTLPHPNYREGSHKWAVTEYGGKEYLTTPGMLEAARQTWHELDQMPKANATFYGEGLVQAMALDYKPKPSGAPSNNVVAYNTPELISAEYRDLQRQLHTANPYYGVGGGKHAKTVIDIAKSLGTHSILDYGCGRGFLGEALAKEGYPIWEYDPAIPGKDAPARPADIVICSDVLEHVEPDRILYVLDDLRRVTRKVAYLVIHCGPSSKTLADGRNAHILQRNPAWWRKQLGKFFGIAKVFEKYPLLYVVAGPQSRPKQKPKPADAPAAAQPASAQPAAEGGPC